MLADSAYGSHMLGYDEAAAILGVSPGTLRRWVSEGRISHVKIGRRKVGFRLVDLDSVLRLRRGGTGL